MAVAVWLVLWTSTQSTRVQFPSDHMTGSDSRIIGGPVWHVLWKICMCAAMAADKYSPRSGPEMDEKRANEKRLSEERLESSPEVDKSTI